MDDGECLILGVEQVWAEGELMKRVQEISAAVHELFKQSKYGCTKEAGFEAWGKQLKLCGIKTGGAHNCQSCRQWVHYQCFFNGFDIERGAFSEPEQERACKDHDND